MHSIMLVFLIRTLDPGMFLKLLHFLTPSIDLVLSIKTLAAGMCLVSNLFCIHFMIIHSIKTLAPGMCLVLMTLDTFLGVLLWYVVFSKHLGKWMLHLFHLNSNAFPIVVAAIGNCGLAVLLV